MSFINYIQAFNFPSVCIRLILATILGGLVGLERASHGQAAGLRTFALVCLGAALAMVTDEYLISYYGTGDPARLAAQVISGIGFLGVGTIMVTGKSYVKGLTTAASLWATASLGITIGSGYIEGGLIGFLLIILIVTLLTIVSRHQEENSRIINLYMEVDKSKGINDFLDYIRQNSYSLTSIDKQKNLPVQGKDMIINAMIDMKKRRSHAAVLDELNKLVALHYVEEMK